MSGWGAHRNQVALVDKEDSALVSKQQMEAINMPEHCSQNLWLGLYCSTEYVSIGLKPDVFCKTAQSEAVNQRSRIDLENYVLRYLKHLVT